MVFGCGVGGSCSKSICGGDGDDAGWNAGGNEMSNGQKEVYLEAGNEE